MAYTFKPYLTLPTNSRGNPYFISTSSGGDSHCIVRGSGGYTLPNCVALVHAEVLEVITNALGRAKALELESRLCRNNASVYYGYTADGFDRGQTPKLGAIACWKGGSSGAGHVAFVTGVNGLNWSGRASNYSGSAFYSCSYTYSSTYKYYLGASYTFQGFIYLPYDFSVYATTATTRSSKQEQVRVNIEDLNVRTGAGTGNTRLGYAEPGYYNILNSKADSTYTWYEIETGKWIASKSGANWTTYYPKEEPTMYSVTFKVSAGDVAGLKEYGEKIKVTPTVKKLS